MILLHNENKFIISENHGIKQRKERLEINMIS